MKILFVLEHYYPYIGGTEKLFNLLAESLVRSGHQVTVITTKYEDTLSPQETINGVEVFRVKCYNRFLFTFFSLPIILRKSRSCDIIHTTTYTAALPAWLGGKMNKKRVIVTFHELWGRLWWKLPYLSRIQKLVYFCYEKLVFNLNFDKMIAVSEFTKNAIIDRGKEKEKVIRIYNGLDYYKFESHQHQAPEKFTCTYIGRLGISKGLDILLPAIKLFTAHFSNTQFVLILPQQPAGLRKTITNTIDQLEIRAYITLRSELSTDELFSQISHSSCVVIPSYSEGFCFAAAEAVAMNIPIITSGRGALREVVSRNYIAMKDLTPEALKNALIDAKEGKWKFKSFQAYELKDSIKAYQKLYENLL